MNTNIPNNYLNLLEDCHINGNYSKTEKELSNMVKENIKTINNGHLQILENIKKSSKNPDSYYEYIISNCHLSNPQKAFIINNCNSAIPILKMLKTNRYLNDNLIENCLSRISDTLIIKECEKSTISDDYPFSYEVIEYITKNYYDKYENYILSFTQNRDFISELIQKDNLNEIQYLRIANNIDLEESVRNLAFDRTDNIMDVFNPTPHMNTVIFHSALESLAKEKTDCEPNDYALDFINQGISESRFPESCQLDLLLQKNESLMYQKINVEYLLAKYTKFPSVVEKIIEDGYPDNKYHAAANDKSNIEKTEQILNSILNIEDELRQKAKMRNCNYSDLLKRYINDKSCTCLENFDKTADKIVKITNKHDLKELLCLQNIPVPMLEKLIEHPNNEIAFISRVVLALHLKGIDKHTENILKDMKLIDTKASESLERTKGLLNITKLEQEKKFLFVERYTKHIATYEQKRVLEVLSKLIISEKEELYKDILTNAFEILKSNFEKEKHFLKSGYFSYNLNKKECQIDIEMIIKNKQEDQKQFIKTLTIAERKYFAQEIKKQTNKLLKNNMCAFYISLDKICEFYNLLTDKELLKEKENIKNVLEEER